MQWSAQQDYALKQVSNWLKSPEKQQIFRLFGFAGTGKSTLAIHLASDLQNVCFCAFTGKAAMVMRSKGCDGAQTIHSLIYQVDDQSDGGDLRVSIDPNSKAKHADLIVVDECSMVNEELARDLMSFNRPILVLGDPAQLPPVRGQGFFINVERPDVMLNEIHRQAQDNPIIQIATSVRNGKSLDRGYYGESKIIGLGDVAQSDILSSDQVLVGKNDTRVQYNRRIRSLKNHSGLIVEGERLVCLSNDKDKRIFNGGLFNVTKLNERDDEGPLSFKVAEVGSQRKPFDVKCWHNFLDGTEQELMASVFRGTQQFTYGYVLTVHKSQGSQWDNVYIFDQSYAFRKDSKKWLYTAITRASEKVTIVQT